MFWVAFLVFKARKPNQNIWKSLYVKSRSFKNLTSKLLKIVLLLITRDNGIVISISIAQLIFEPINILFFHIYIHVFYGYSFFIDKFFDLFNILSLMVIAPCFYLRGDEIFRRNWITFGPLKAITIAFF